MVRWIAFASLCGAGFTALLSLALHFAALLHLSHVDWLALVLLTPGGLIQVLLLPGSDSPIEILSANFVVYSALVFVVVSSLSAIQQTAESRWINLSLAVPVGVLVCLACIPILDPLWPTGMTQLARREAQLHGTLPVGIDLEQARGILRSEGIQFWEEVQESDSIILSRPDGSISAASGDTVVSAQIPTNAGQFPCGYRIDVVLVFGKDRKLTESYVHRFRICP